MKNQYRHWAGTARTAAKMLKALLLSAGLVFGLRPTKHCSLGQQAMALRPTTRQRFNFTNAPTVTRPALKYHVRWQNLIVPTLPLHLMIQTFKKIPLKSLLIEQDVDTQTAVFFYHSYFKKCS